MNEDTLEKKVAALVSACWRRQLSAVEWRREYMRWLLKENKEPAELTHILTDYFITQIYVGSNPSPKIVSYLLDGLQYRLISPDVLFGLINQYVSKTSHQQFKVLFKVYNQYISWMSISSRNALSILQFTKNILEFILKGIIEQQRIKTQDDPYKNDFNVLLHREPLMRNAMLSIQLFEKVIQDDRIAQIFMLAADQNYEGYGEFTQGLDTLTNWMFSNITCEYSQPFLKCAAMFYQIPSRFMFKRSQAYWSRSHLPKPQLYLRRAIITWMYSKIHINDFKTLEEDCNYLKFLAATFAMNMHEFFVELWGCYHQYKVDKDEIVSFEDRSFLFTRVFRIIREIVHPSIQHDPDILSSLLLINNENYQMAYRTPNYMINRTENHSLISLIAASLNQRKLVSHGVTSQLTTLENATDHHRLILEETTNEKYAEAQGLILGLLSTTCSTHDLCLSSFLHNMAYCKDNLESLKMSIHIPGDDNFLQIIRVNKQSTDYLYFIWELLEHVGKTLDDEYTRFSAFSTVFLTLHKLFTLFTFADIKEAIRYSDLLVNPKLSCIDVARCYIDWIFSHVSLKTLTTLIESKVAQYPDQSTPERKLYDCWMKVVVVTAREMSEYYEKVVQSGIDKVSADCESRAFQKEVSDIILAAILLFDMSLSSDQRGRPKPNMKLLFVTESVQPIAKWLRKIHFPNHHMVPQGEYGSSYLDPVPGHDSLVAAVRALNHSYGSASFKSSVTEFISCWRKIPSEKAMAYVLKYLSSFTDQSTNIFVDGGIDMLFSLISIHSNVSHYCDLASKLIPQWLVKNDGNADPVVIALLCMNMAANCRLLNKEEETRFQRATSLLIGLACEIVQSPSRDVKYRLEFADAIITLFSSVPHKNSDMLSVYGNKAQITSVLQTPYYREFAVIIPHKFQGLF